MTTSAMITVRMPFYEICQQFTEILF